MKKLLVTSVIAASIFTLTACSATPPGDTSGTSRETVTVGGDKFDCIFEDRNTNWGAMSCRDIQVKASPGEKDSQGFTRNNLVVGGEKFDCIFEDRNTNWGTMSCFSPS